MLSHREIDTVTRKYPASMNSLYNHGIKQTQLLSKDISSFEANLSTSPLSLQGSITTSLGAFRKTIREYSDLIHQNAGDELNAKHEQRLSKFEQDLQAFSTKFDTLKRERETVQHETNKQELLGRRNVGSGLGGALENPYAQQQQQQQLSYQEGLYKEKQSLSRGSQQLDHILEMGQQTFEDLVEQNDVLRKLGQKFEESLITLGVSQGTIKRIEKRAKQDKWLFWGGVILMFFCFYMIIKFFK